MSALLDPVRRLLAGLTARLRSLSSPRPAPREPGAPPEELLQVPLAGGPGSFFAEEEKPSHQAVHAAGRLELRLRRRGLFAWAEAPGYELGDFGLLAQIAFEPGSGYAAAGFLFRYASEADFYSVLVSNRGHFRLDLVFNGSPRTLVAWTELPGAAAGSAEASTEPLSHSLRLIARGTRLTLLVDGAWAAELDDDSIRSGLVAFAAQTYAEEGAAAPASATFRLDSLVLESRPAAVEAWHSQAGLLLPPDGAARLRLAESHAARGEWLKAAVELRKVEKRRAQAGLELGPAELLLKAEVSLRLELYEEAGQALDACLRAEPRRREALLEKGNVLYLRSRFEELKAYCGEAAGLLAPDDLDGQARLALLRAHARSNQGDHRGAAEDYARAAELSPDQPLLRMNEARSREQAGDKAGAVEAYIAAARGFYEAEADDDLSLALGRLAALAPRRNEVKGLRAKALFRAGKKEEAARLIAGLLAKGSTDPALHYLDGILRAGKGDRRGAAERFRRALELEPGYPLFAFRHAENLVLLAKELPRKGEAGARPAEEEVDAAIDAALALQGGQTETDGWILNLAGGRLLEKAASRPGRPEADEAALRARSLLSEARRLLPERPEPAINLAELELRSGHYDEALALLEAFPDDGPARNEAGNVLAARAAELRAAELSAADPRAAPEGLDEKEAAEKRLDEVEALLWRAAREYEAATRLQPGQAGYQANLAACWLELGRYSEAEERIGKALALDPDPHACLIAGKLALVYGDRPRAETAYRLGLERDPRDPALLLAAGRSRLLIEDGEAAEQYRRRLEDVDPERAALLAAEILAATTIEQGCAACGRTWRSPRSLPAQVSASIRAMPPDDSPAGACPSCGKIYCIACRKSALEDSRFTCPDCGEVLKLGDDRLRWLVREHLRRHAAEAAR